MSLISTLDLGRTHFAQSAKYLGSVNSYNNWFTRLISKIFRKSIKVTDGNQTYCLNKKSFSKFIRRLDGSNFDLKNYKAKEIRLDATCQELKIAYDPALAPVSVGLPANGGLMRNHLSAGKVNTLTKGLMQSLIQGDVESAKKAVQKGANVNEQIWLRDKNFIFKSKGNYSTDIDYRRNHHYTSRLVTPMVYASLAGSPELMQHMETFGGSKEFIGQVVDFKRTIMGVQHHQSVRQVPAFNGRPAHLVPVYIRRTTFNDLAVQTHNTAFDPNLNCFRDFIHHPQIIENEIKVRSDNPSASRGAPGMQYMADPVHIPVYIPAMPKFVPQAPVAQPGHNVQLPVYIPAMPQGAAHAPQLPVFVSQAPVVAQPLPSAPPLNEKQPPKAEAPVKKPNAIDAVMNFDDGIEDEFVDPITEELMSDPVKICKDPSAAVKEYVTVVDRSTIHKFKKSDEQGEYFVNPESTAKLYLNVKSNFVDDVELKAKIANRAK